MSIGHTTENWKGLIQTLSDDSEVQRSDWEVEFLSSVAEQLESRGDLSPKQKKKIVEIAQRIKVDTVHFGIVAKDYLDD